jgi:HD-GYP domain-containing protein (c-di-GMP phosphodiesterase class II)
MQSTSLKVSLSELIIAVSNALDLMSPSFHSHQKRTCIIACKLGREIGLSEQDYSNLYYASLLHDVGAIGLQEKIDLLGFEEQDADHHALMGAALLDNSRLLSPITPLIKYHHQPWRNGQGKEFPELAHLIHLSDRLEVQCHIPNLLAHSQKIRELIKDGSGGTFKPEHVDVFLRLSEVDAFWFDLKNENVDEIVQSMAPDQFTDLSYDDLLGITKFISLIIDSRSHFTAKHSSGVEKCAEVIGQLMGLDEKSLASLIIASYLHDIGKLSISNELLEKPTHLSEDEYAIMKEHVYKTYKILSKVRGLEEVALIASSHHERLNGHGYPFSKKAEELSLSQRILAFADVFTALAEIRPYKQSLSTNQIEGILNKEVSSGGLDPDIFQIVMKNIDLIRKEVLIAQSEAEQQLSGFWKRSPVGV